MQPTLILILLLPVALAALALLLRRHRQHLTPEELSPITRQHIDLFQGGQLNEAAVEAVKARFRTLLERGDVAGIEASMRAGPQYVVQVRALAELGTDDAGRILERQLGRRLSDDLIEQGWYWIDLASGLRSLNRSQSLPHLLRCAESASDLPLGHLFAAETVCFLGFGGYLRQSRSGLGRAALRVLHRALEGLRFGIQPSLVSEARLGELVEGLWDARQDRIDPLVIRIFQEALRTLRRAPHAEPLLAGDGVDQEAFSWQVARLAALEPALIEYLHDAPPLLLAELARIPAGEHREALLALADLRADTGDTILDLLRQPGYSHAEIGVEVLLFSTHTNVGPMLREWVMRRVPMVRRAQKRRRAVPPRRLSVPSDVPYRAILRTLRGHPSPPTEACLLLAARDWDPTYRLAAIGSLGWWEPLDRPSVLAALQDARRDGNPEVRQAARAALARLGERQSLQWFRQTLTSEDPHRVHETIQTVASENLTLLWPDLDRLADAEDLEVAHYASEALERMCEDLDRRRG
jgi:hypothetical protein